MEAEDSLVVLESDKASMEIPTPVAGEVLEILVEEGAEVKEGDALVRLMAADQTSDPSETASAQAAPAVSAATVETVPLKPVSTPAALTASGDISFFIGNQCSGSCWSGSEKTGQGVWG